MITLPPFRRVRRKAGQRDDGRGNGTLTLGAGAQEGTGDARGCRRGFPGEYAARRFGRGVG